MEINANAKYSFNLSFPLYFSFQCASVPITVPYLRYTRCFSPFFWYNHCVLWYLLNFSIATIYHILSVITPHSPQYNPTFPFKSLPCTLPLLLLSHSSLLQSRLFQSIPPYFCNPRFSFANGHFSLLCHSYYSCSFLQANIIKWQTFIC